MSNSPEGKFSQQEYFVVSSREYKTIFENCHLTEQDIMDLPQGAVIVEVGSGEFQEFAREAKKQRPDIKVVSIDPTLSLEPKREDISINDESDSKIYFLKEKPENLKDVKRYQKIQERRRQTADKKGTVAAFAPFLPLKSESVGRFLRSRIIYKKKRAICTLCRRNKKVAQA